jgi:DNA-binding response OmpR family regulator
VYLQHFSPSWREFHRRQLAQTRVLVVDDDQRISRLLAKILRREGFSADTAASASEAWDRMCSQSFDLFLVDKTMPGESGLDLIQRMRDAGHQTPVILITGDASIETVDKALALGAEDYITKPFGDTEHLIRRMRSVLDRRITSLLFDVLINDLTKAVNSGVESSDVFVHVSREILKRKVELGRRTPCFVIDEQPERAQRRRDAIYEAGVIARTMSPKDIGRFENLSHRPLVAVVDLETQSALGILNVLRSSYPQVELFACAKEVPIDVALRAVSAGAAEFALLQESGLSGFARRVVRLVRQTRRHHLYLDIVAILYRAARQARPDLAEDIIFVTSGSEREYILTQSGESTEPSST